MSHLPLDARAVLEYLNELGYRNITAAQLKEFLKGMQPHSEVPSSTTKTTAASTRNCVTPNPKNAANNKALNLKSPSFCKLVKGKKPLINFNFYLDIKDHQISKKVEERITELGGTLEFFLTKSVTHFITDRSPPDRRASSNQQSRNGYCVKSPTTAGGVSGGGVGGGGGGIGIGYPITPSSYIQSPQTPATPQTPYTNHTHSGGDSATDGVASNNSRIGGVLGIATTPNNKKKNSRADAMLHRALQSQQQTQSANQTFASKVEEEEKRPHLEPGAYTIWDLDYAIRFLKKVTADIKQYAKKSQQPITKGACEPIQLKGHFIKIESIKRHSRPYYSVFRKIEWPKVHFKEDGAFRFTPKEDELKSAKDKPSKTNAMTRKSRSSSKHNHNHMRLKAKQAPKQVEKPAVVENSSEKQCGVCEICKIEYDTLTIHLKTKDHEFFARNQSNYLALDSLIKSSANVDKFLHENTKADSKPELVVEPMEVDEEMTRQTRQSSRIQTPPPPLKIKTKLKEIECHSSVPDKKPSTNNNVKRPAKSSAPLDSPPIRHPLPASTLYKVVEDTKSRTEPATPQTPSIIVKFRKIRQTELSILNGEAENFMFPKRPASSECTDSDRQTSTDSNRISSSSISSESHSIDEHHPAITTTMATATTTTSTTEEQAGSVASKRRRTVADSSRKSTTTVTSVCYQSFPNTPIQPDQTSRVTRERRDTCRNSVTPKPTTQRRQRSTASGRKRCGTGRSRRQEQGQRRRQRCASEDGMGDEDTEGEDEKYLRRLIKYEESLGVNVHQKDYFDSLYRKTTASYRAKMDAAAAASSGGFKSTTERDRLGSATASGKTLDRDNLENGGLRRKEQMEKKSKSDVDDGVPRRRHPRDGVLKENNAIQQRSAEQTKTKNASKTRETTASAAVTTNTARTSRATEKSTSVMWIRPRSKTPHSGSNKKHHMKMDPVQLYQYYSNEWERFKTNLPGENSRSDLRWQIRHKLLGE